MLIFWFGFIIMLAGLASVGYLMLSEKKQEQIESPPEPAVKKPELSIHSFLQRVGLGPKAQTVSTPPEVKASRFDFLKNLSSLVKKESPSVEQISFSATSVEKLNSEGTAALRLDQKEFSSPPPIPKPLSATKASSDEVDVIIRVEELEKELKQAHERYERLDKMFQEKSIGLEKTEKNLMAELKVHKEFNKVKDVLEKEIKDSKEKSRELEIAVASAQTEGQSFLKRVNQLEEKIKKLEKEVREKEEESRQAQQTVELQKIKFEDLETKLKKSEETVQEKMKKINELVGHLQDHKTAAAEPVPAAAETPAILPQEPAAVPIETTVSAAIPSDTITTPPEPVHVIPEPPADPMKEQKGGETEQPAASEPGSAETRPGDSDQKQKAIDALKDTFKEAFEVTPEPAQPEEQQIIGSIEPTPESTENIQNPSTEEELPVATQSAEQDQNEEKPAVVGVPLSNLLNLIKSKEVTPEEKPIHLMPDILSSETPQSTESENPDSGTEDKSKATPES